MDHSFPPMRLRAFFLSFFFGFFCVFLNILYHQGVSVVQIQPNVTCLDSLKLVISGGSLLQYRIESRNGHTTLPCRIHVSFIVYMVIPARYSCSNLLCFKLCPIVPCGTAKQHCNTTEHILERYRRQ